MSVYACGDLHGRLDIYRKIKEFLKPEDRVIFLGDANDRGPAPWALVKEILTDPQFIYLRGNHEEMLFDLFELYWQGELDQDILTQAASDVEDVEHLTVRDITPLLEALEHWKNLP